MSLSGADLPRPAELKKYHIKSYDRIDPRRSGFDGNGKTVFVTGGSSGSTYRRRPQPQYRPGCWRVLVGYSICRAFAAAGVAKIVIVSRSPGPLTKTKEALNNSFPDVQVDTVAASITDFDAMTAALKAAGPIDVMVLNAYYSHALNVPSSTVPASEIEKTFQATVVANWHLIQTYINSTPVPASGERTAIAVTSAAAHLNIPLNSGYAASKAALSRMIGSLALEYSPETNGVRLVSMHPGIIMTEGALGQGFPEEGPVWVRVTRTNPSIRVSMLTWWFDIQEHVDLPGDFAVWLAGKESAFLHGRLLWAQWDVDELLALKGKMEKDPMFLQIGLVY
jgi:NAD(P)-dependent dehydrogenase (short-subunit alcohol dehydrogenase family)